MPESLVDRFVTVRVDDPSPEGILALPEGIREFAWNLGRASGDRRVSLRKFTRLAEGLASKRLDPETIARLIFGRDRAPEVIDGLRIAGML